MSSGGWNTVILATTGDVGEYTVGSTTMDLEGDLGGNTGCSSRVQAAWASCPPTDFSAMNDCGSIMDHDAPDSPEGSIIGGRVSENPDINALANPITFVSRDDPPMYLRHGSDDNIVPTCQSELLWDAIVAIGNEKDMDYTPQPGQGHALGVSLICGTPRAAVSRRCGFRPRGGDLAVRGESKTPGTPFSVPHPPT